MLLSVMLLAASSAPARAEIASTELLGDQANLMSGAVIASTRGGASIWYNPSRLSFGSGERFTFAVSGVGFAYRYYNVPNLVATSSGSSPGTSSEMLVLPRATTLVVRWSDRLYWGVGLFTPARQDVAVQAGSSEPGAPATSFNAVALHVRRNILHTMASLSWKVNERLLLGAGLANVNYSYLHSSQISSARYDPNTGSAMAVFTEASQQNNYGYGMRVTLGMSLQLSEHWVLAASVAAPTWLFYTNVSEVVSRTTGQVDSDALTFSGKVQEKKGGAWDAPEPGVGRLGLAYTSPRIVVELDADISGGAKSSDFNIDAPVVGNVHAGALIGLMGKVRLGFGVYTDFESRNKQLSELGDSRTRGVGATCGLNFVSRLPGSVAKAGDPTGTYSITVATRYMHYRGEVLSLDVSDAMADQVALTPTDGVVHEVAAQVGLNAAW